MSCGGRVLGEGSGPEVASEAQIAGACFGLDGSAATCGLTIDSCQCGVAGNCVNGACAPKSCDPGYFLDGSGDCESVYWFSSVSNHTCYGSPPLLV